MLVTPGMGQGALHDHSDLCMALLGRAGGALHPGQHRNFDKKVPVANLHVALLRALDVNVSNFGTTSTGAIDML
ncbi:MAG: hypothetical protein EOO40_02210 [Deltaproteobacteria bacterium]|nr:MAG: hypothetical protein EOO40_02210 [Deltaproteobacteria bacterium]